MRVLARPAGPSRPAPLNTGGDLRLFLRYRLITGIHARDLAQRQHTLAGIRPGLTALLRRVVASHGGSRRNAA